MPTPNEFDKIERNQRLTKPGYIELYQIRLEKYVSPTITNVEYVNFTSHINEDQVNDVQALLNGPYQFGVKNFMPLPVQLGDIEYNATSRAPSRPTLVLSVINPQIVSLLQNYNNLIGQTIIRWKTYVDLLPAGSDYWGPYEQFIFYQLISRNNTHVSWKLSGWMDRPKQLPGEIVTSREFAGVPLRAPV